MSVNILFSVGIIRALYKLKKKLQEKTIQLSFSFKHRPRLELKVGGVIGDRQNPHRVSVAKAALPTLDGNDRAARLDQTQFQTHPQAISDTVVHLLVETMSICVCLRLHTRQHSHPSATGGSQCPSVRGTTRGSKPCAGEADELSVRYE
jgi:hypothetical protein